jgi:hypothetical protein
MKSLAIFFMTMLLCAHAAPPSPNQLPAVAIQALNSSDSVVLYSLEPYTEDPDADRNWKGAKFDGYNCLGKLPLTGRQTQVAIAEFTKAIPEEKGPVASCFDPRHALRVVSGHHTYDFLLCFQCGQMEVNEDNKSIADLCAYGSPDALNKMLKKAGIPISYIFSEAYIKAEQQRMEKSKSDSERWLAAVPPSLRPFLPKDTSSDPAPYFEAPSGSELEALAKEFPDESKRIRVVLAWYGSDAGPWSGYPSYEQIPENILLTFPTAKIVSALQAKPLREVEIEGAARLFGGWDFSQKRPGDLRLLPQVLKKRFLDHALKSKDDDKIDRARHAFQ